MKKLSKYPGLIKKLASHSFIVTDSLLDCYGSRTYYFICQKCNCVIFSREGEILHKLRNKAFANIKIDNVHVKFLSCNEALMHEALS